MVYYRNKSAMLFIVLLIHFMGGASNTCSIVSSEDKFVSREKSVIYIYVVFQQLKSPQNLDQIKSIPPSMLLSIGYRVKCAENVCVH